MNQAPVAESSTFRSGRYVSQPTGYRAFIPNPLPPKPKIRMDGELQAILSRADRALGRLDGSIQTLPNPALFVFMYVRKEAVLSSQIEGTQSSINDVLEAEAQLFNPERRKDVAEVLSYVEAMNHGLARLKTLPLSIRLIREIHEKLMHGVRGRNQQPGEIRGTQNWIGPQGCTLNEATFVPPPPSIIEEALSDLEKFMHEDGVNMPILVKIGLIHSQFETIHPFLDGNGRIGRLLITFLLCEKEILLEPVLYISHYLKKYRDDYYNLLQAVRDRGEWEPWLKFFLEAVATVSNEATETARKIVDLRENHRSLITREFGRAAGNGLAVLEHLFRMPIVQVNDVKALLDISYAGANGTVRRFVGAKLLSEMTGHGRNRRFRYGPYIDLFAEN